jgi:hypothetical protein
MNKEGLALAEQYFCNEFRHRGAKARLLPIEYSFTKISQIESLNTIKKRLKSVFDLFDLFDLITI